MSCKDDILERLRTLRKARSLRQDYAASAIGVDRTTYVRKEQGRIPITTEEWVMLAAAMGVAPAYFFEDGPDPAAGPGSPEPGELEFIMLYRALRPEEREDLAGAVSLLLKGIRRGAVTEAVDRIRAASFRTHRG